MLSYRRYQDDNQFLYVTSDEFNKQPGMVFLSSPVNYLDLGNILHHFVIDRSPRVRIIGHLRFLD
jgi:hypothetical protein